MYPADTNSIKKCDHFNHFTIRWRANKLGDWTAYETKSLTKNIRYSGSSISLEMFIIPEHILAHIADRSGTDLTW